MGTLPKVDWEVVFYDYAARPAPERSMAQLAEAYGVSLDSVKQAAKRHRWTHRLKIIDGRAREERDKRAIRKLADRLEDNVRIVEAMRVKFAQHLRDPAYQPTAQEFFAMAKLELLMEGRDTQKIGLGTISDEFRETIRQLPVYMQQRLLASTLTGVPYHEVMEIEAELVGEEDDDGPTD